MFRNQFAFLILGFAYVLLVASGAAGQESNSQTNETKTKTRNNIYHHLGSVELPDGFRGFVRAKWVDAWAGTIESSDSALTIDWRAGLVEKVENSRHYDKISSYTETTPFRTVVWSRLRDQDKETLVATIGWLEFSVSLSGSKDEEIFRDIVQSFSKERCIACSSFRFLLPKE